MHIVSFASECALLFIHPWLSVVLFQFFKETAEISFNKHCCLDRRLYFFSFCTLC